MNFKLAAILLLSSNIAFNSFAESTHNYFDNVESSRYNKDLPKYKDNNNRFDDEPIITIKSFDLTDLQGLSNYNIQAKELEDICLKSLKDNNNRYSIDRLNRLTKSLTKHFRDQGLLLARVYIPEQNIKNNIVKFSMVKGIIEDVRSSQLETTKNTSDLYHESTLSRPFRALTDKPSYRADLESAMIRLGSYPGLKTETQFMPGSTQGNTQLNIQVTEQNKFNGFLTFDNFGSEYTGSYRVQAKGYINNFTGNADQLSIGLLTTLNPTNSYYGSLGYEIPIEVFIKDSSMWSFLNPFFYNGYLFSTGMEQNTYSIGKELESLNIKGEASTYFYALSKPWLLNSKNKIRSQIRLDLKTARSQQNGKVIDKDKLTVISLNNSYSFVDYLFDRANTAFHFDIHQGLETTLGSMSNDDENSRLGENTGYAPANFTKYNFEFSRLQQVDSFQLLTKFNYQHSDDTLIALEQIALGGPYAVRGYTSADYSADTAFQTTIELVGQSYAEKLSLPIDNLTAAVFLDYAIGWRNDALANEVDSSHLLAVGWYADFIKEEKFQTRMQMGFPLSKDKPVNGNSVQFFLSAQRRF